MSDTDRDPPRLSQSGDSAFLRDAIRESKSDLPDEARLAAIALKLGPIVGIAGGAAGGGGAAAAGGGAAAKASVAPAAAKIGGMTLGMKIAAAAAVTAVAVGGTAVVAPRVMSNKPAVTAPTAMVSAARASSSSTSTTIDLSLPPASASAGPLPVPKPTATMTVPPNPDDEMRTLDRAQAALNANDPATALSLCNDDAIEFPHGTNAQEREVMAINALTRLGKMNEAKARAKKFEKDYPGSAALPRVHQLVGGSP
ncbi:MAG: hypothetical protein ACRELY_05275 [Polyangiaceae bacterium]